MKELDHMDNARFLYLYLSPVHLYPGTTIYTYIIEKGLYAYIQYTYIQGPLYTAVNN